MTLYYCDLEEQDWNSVLVNPLVLPSLSFCRPIYATHSIQVPFRVNGRQNCHFPIGWWLFFSYFCSHSTLWERVSVIHYKSLYFSNGQYQQHSFTTFSYPFYYLSLFFLKKSLFITIHIISACVTFIFP